GHAHPRRPVPLRDAPEGQQARRRQNRRRQDRGSAPPEVIPRPRHDGARWPLRARDEPIRRPRERDRREIPHAGQDDRRRPGAARHGAPSALVLLAAVAWADHGGPLRGAPMSPLTSALVFAGLALLVGALVVVIVAVLTRGR